MSFQQKFQQQVQAVDAELAKFPQLQRYVTCAIHQHP